MRPEIGSIPSPERRSRRYPAAAVVIASLLLGGCIGTDDNTTALVGNERPHVACAQGVASGAGSTFVQTIVQQWVKVYGAACAGTTVNYQGIGSGGGIQQFSAGTVDFAGTDVPMTATELGAARANQGDVAELPWAAGGIALEYKLSGVAGLRLRPATIARIFAGQVKRWDDPVIKADNPAAALPRTPIQVVHRSDGSGTTAAFTSYLASVGQGIWTAGSGKDVRWPTGQGAKGSDGVTAQVRSTEGAIGYAEVSYARSGSLGVVKVGNAAGRFVDPTAGAVTAALTTANVMPDGTVALDFATPDPEAYPISTVTYVVLARAPRDAGRGALLRSFVGYALGDGQSVAERLAYAPLPERIALPARRLLASMGSGS